MNNVYCFQLPNNASSVIPVLVFIHGGAFSMGQASSYISGPEFFMENDVVLVTIYYRLGPFGMKLILQLLYLLPFLHSVI